MFLIDTNVLSLAQKSRQNPNLHAWLVRQDDIAIPFPVLLEIQHGIVEVAKRQPDKGAALQAWLDTILASDFTYPEITPAVAKKLAEMNCCPPLKTLWHSDAAKDRKPGQDLFIAAIAIVHGLPIATCNVNDFLLIDRFFALPGLYNPAFNNWFVELGDGSRASGSEDNYLVRTG
jgi:predicted nucleic acid-binding protein